ncbi:MAG: CBS domain-containing protein [Alphaproteobacteria bacterium]|nr:CBS domain-containing protein [Alphaproteobacteria bacterium]
MATIKQLLDQKGHTIHSIARDATVLEAIRKMAENDVGSLMVMQGDRLVGLITERHYARNVFLKGKSSPTTRVEEIMQTNILVARPEQTVEECMAVMTKNRVRHLPVVDGSKICGIVSIGDLVNSIIADQKFAIAQLEHYIRS